MEGGDISPQAIEENVERFLTFAGATKPPPNAVFILVMGITGTGKSSFIEACTGELVTIGHGLESCEFTSQHL